MSFPPFPSQDLAKLVLGYLAEEQLMTVYDEFLMASPYLDALQNEYNRIFMKSLQSILSEYWAVKIYVEKCKPFTLRKKLTQCSNLLEVVKFLISNIDMKKIHNNNTPVDKNGLRTTNTVLLKDNVCDVDATPTNVIETTLLADLPGNTALPVKRRHVKVLDKNSSEAARLLSTSENSEGQTASANSIQYEALQSTVVSNPYTKSGEDPLLMSPDWCGSTKTNLDNFNIVLTIEDDNNKADNIKKRMSAAPTFKDFSTGIEAGTHVIVSLPDSSTSESINNKLTNSSKMDSTSNIPVPNQHAFPNIIQLPSKTKYLVKVCNEPQQKTATNLCSEDQDKIAESLDKQKIEENKIQILSDIKVGNNTGSVYCTNSKMAQVPTVLRSATSTPLVPLKAIVINGKSDSQPDSQRKLTFTRDEIMAMPTLFWIPSSGPPPFRTMAKPIQTNAFQTSASTASVTSSTAVNPCLEPLTIDITDSPVEKCNSSSVLNMPSISATKCSKSNLITTVDLKNLSVPKDSIVPIVGKPSTPQILPPTRKSSSTPRRTSHVRVLDFATPRRILHETIKENPVEMLVSQSPNMRNVDDEVPEMVIDTSKTFSSEEQISNNTKKSPVIKLQNKPTVTAKKYNWDANLRALAVANIQTTPQSNDKLRSRKQKPKDKEGEQKGEEKIKKDTNVSSNTKTSKKKKKKHKDYVESESKTVEVSIKPTINIISDWNTATVSESEKQENKLGGESQADTPELDRICLQNDIGAKLNISDLLETPYKQALYDIQMETPKFLQPELPGEALSEIKITDIPTPRFFDTPGVAITPKPPQITPSSYTSRPTDYSSGGSYYKPDEQDYALQSEDLGYSMPSIEKLKSEKNKENIEINRKSDDKSRRPVRQCTKNVSYYTRSLNEKLAVEDSSSKEIILNESLNESNKSDVSINHKTVCKTKAKQEPKRKSSGSKKRRTPVKKVKTFIKIKPRRPTPTKDRGKRGNIADLSLSKKILKKTTSSKENSCSIPQITPALTKSRRKSSTPRKLHAKIFNSQSPDNISNDSVDVIKGSIKTSVSCAQDSDTENLPLRWSDDTSQNGNTKEAENISVHDSEDIAQIKEYIEKSLLNKEESIVVADDEVGSLHQDLVKRGFDLETAKSIERDLLDTPVERNNDRSSDVINMVTINKAQMINTLQLHSIESIPQAQENTLIIEKPESESSSSNKSVVQDENGDVEEIELSMAECNLETNNYIVCKHDHTVKVTETNTHTLNDNFNMEFCIEDDFAIRIRLTTFRTLLNLSPKELNESISIKETEAAVSSIANIDRLYSPMKSQNTSITAQCKELFDSTLTSLASPLKEDGQERNNKCTEVILEVEQIVEKDDPKDKSTKKRKRLQSASSTEESSLQDSKKTKRDTKYLPNIQNIDIESVLSKLHGP